MNTKKLILLFFVVIDIIIADTLTKYWAHISDPHFPVLGEFLRVDHVKNTGVAFGTQLPGIDWIIPVILVLIGAFLSKKWSELSEYEKTGYLFILTGGSLNAVERMIFGSVTDFINVPFFSVFNVADMAITAGVILLFWHSIAHNHAQK